MELSRPVARRIIETVGGPGQPPDYGFQYFSAGLAPYLNVIEKEYLTDFIRDVGSSFKMVVGPYGGGKTHMLYSNREEECETICQWLRGEGYVRTSHAPFGILQRIDKTTAFSMIRSLVQLCRDLGFSGLVVLLDETEPSSSLNTRQRETLLVNLRE